MSLAVRTPASSANLGAGFDVFGMALDLVADIGIGAPPPDARVVDDHHPAREAFDSIGGTGPIWERSTIPMGRGLGYSGAVRVAAATLGALADGASLADAGDQILSVATRLEGHGDNAAASLYGGIVADLGTGVQPLRVGPSLAAGRVVAWIPGATTSTDRSRRGLPEQVAREDAVFNLGRVTQFVLAVERDEPHLLAGATDDRLHQAIRLQLLPGGEQALIAGQRAGAWCGWLSGSGPTVAFLVPADRVDAVIAAMPPGGHTKVMAIDRRGTRIVDPAGG